MIHQDINSNQKYSANKPTNTEQKKHWKTNSPTTTHFKAQDGQITCIAGKKGHNKQIWAEKHNERT